MEFFTSALIRWSVETFTDKAFQIFVRNLRVGSLERAIKCEWKIMVSQVLEDRSKVDQLSDSWGRNGASLPFYSNEVKGEWLSASIRTQRGMWVHIFIFSGKFTMSSTESFLLIYFLCLWCSHFKEKSLCSYTYSSSIGKIDRDTKCILLNLSIL